MVGLGNAALAVGVGSSCGSTLVAPNPAIMYDPKDIACRQNPSIRRHKKQTGKRETRPVVVCYYASSGRTKADIGERVANALRKAWRAQGRDLIKKPRYLLVPPSSTQFHYCMCRPSASSNGGRNGGNGRILTLFGVTGRGWGAPGAPKIAAGGHAMVLHERTPL